MKKYLSYQLRVTSYQVFIWLFAINYCLLTIGCSEHKEPAKDLGIIETHPVHGSITQASFKVWGNCETCKDNIETAARFKGVTFCAWDTATKVCTVTYDTRETNVDAVEKAIAAVGYDTDAYKGDDKAYADLAPCCQYDRKK